MGAFVSDGPTSTTAYHRGGVPPHYLHARWSVDVLICLTVYLCVYLFVDLSTHLFAYLSASLSLSLCLCLSLVPFVRLRGLFVCQSVSSSVLPVGFSVSLRLSLLVAVSLSLSLSLSLAVSLRLRLSRFLPVSVPCHSLLQLSLSLSLSLSRPIFVCLLFCLFVFRSVCWFVRLSVSSSVNLCSYFATWL